ncbi:unnamed protein product, partial [Polarella glacialis]
SSLMRLCDGPVLERFCPDLPQSWQQTLVEEGVLRVLASDLLSLLDGDDLAARFASAVLVESPSRQLVAGLCADWHALHFSGDLLAPPSLEAIWASLACLLEAFLAGEMPQLSSAFLPKLRRPSSDVAEVAEGGNSSPATWLEALWLPSGPSGFPLSRCSKGKLVCPTYLGVAALDAKQAQLTSVSGPAAATAAASSAGLAPPLRFVNLSYTTGRWGDPLCWETFLVALGVRPLQCGVPAQRLCHLMEPAGASPVAASEAQAAKVAASLGGLLVSEDWWRQLLKQPSAFNYALQRLTADELDLDWLRRLPVRSERCGTCCSHICCLCGHFLYGSTYSVLGGRYLPYARLPTGGSPADRERLDEAQRCLTSRLGIASELSSTGLLRCSDVLRARGCRDAGIFAE